MTGWRDEGAEPPMRRSTLERLSPSLTVFGILVTTGLGVWSWLVPPFRPVHVGLVVLIILVECRVHFAPHRAAASHLLFMRICFAGMALIMLTSTGVKLAIASELLGADWLAVGRRATGVLTGLGMILYGNFLPKLISPWPLDDEPFDWQGVHRFVGWVFSLGGVAIAGAWLFLPTVDAVRLTVSIVLTTITLSLVRKFFSMLTWNGHRPRKPG
jgi:hypothetical protein